MQGHEQQTVHRGISPMLHRLLKSEGFDSWDPVAKQSLLASCNLGEGTPNLDFSSSWIGTHAALQLVMRLLALMCHVNDLFLAVAHLSLFVFACLP